MKTYVYIDGFNLYYGAVKGTHYRWLNIAEMCRQLLPKHQIIRLKYFTALVTPRPVDPDQLTRQQTYLRALSTLPKLDIIYGHFLTHEVLMPLVERPGAYAKVFKTEEKGSDVNIATHLLTDGYHGRFDAAVIVSNDSDLLAPIRVVKEELHKAVGLLNPQKHPSKVLLANATFMKQIRAGVLANSQFPAALVDAQGAFSKPASW